MGHLFQGEERVNGQLIHCKLKYKKDNADFQQTKIFSRNRPRTLVVNSHEGIDLTIIN